MSLSIHPSFVCHADVVVIRRALGDTLVVNGKYVVVYAIIRGCSPTINDERIADPGDIGCAMRADTTGYQNPSDDASCRALSLLFSRPATRGTPLEYATPSRQLTSDEGQRCTLTYHVSMSLHS